MVTRPSIRVTSTLGPSISTLKLVPVAITVRSLACTLNGRGDVMSDVEPGLAADKPEIAAVLGVTDFEAGGRIQGDDGAIGEPDGPPLAARRLIAIRLHRTPANERAAQREHGNRSRRDGAARGPPPAPACPRDAARALQRIPARREKFGGGGEFGEFGPEVLGLAPSHLVGLVLR